MLRGHFKIYAHFLIFKTTFFGSKKLQKCG